MNIQFEALGWGRAEIHGYFYLSCCDGNKRKLLWDELHASNFNMPWMVVRNFNIVSKQDEKLRGNPININDVNGFNTIISNVELADNDYSSNKFTWCNNKTWEGTYPGKT